MSNSTEISPVQSEIEQQIQRDRALQREIYEDLLREERLNRSQIPTTRISRPSPSTPLRPVTEKQNITIVPLHLHTPQTFIRSAEKLGFRISTSPHIPSTPIMKPEKKTLCLHHPDGQMILIKQRNAGLVVASTSPKQHVNRIIKQHTLDRITEHLSSKGMQIKQSKAMNGEVRITAQETNGVHRDGQAQIQSKIRQDGSLWVDVEKVKGNRCEKIVAEICQAVGGKPEHITRKASYYSFPGEPTKTRIKTNNG